MADEVSHDILIYLPERRTYRTDAIRETLRIADVPYDERVSDQYVICDRATSDESAARIVGFRAVYMLCSIWAGTLPSDDTVALVFGFSLVERTTRMDFSELESLLQANGGAPLRLSLHVEGVSAADVLLRARLRHAPPGSLDSYPLLQRFCAVSDGSESASDEGSDARLDDGGRRCVVM